MYRLTIYHNDGSQDKDEFQDEDFLRDAIEKCINQIEAKEIKTFCVSWLKPKADKPWWED